MRKNLKAIAGQATTEMIFLIPLFVILAAGATSVAYMCWQGIKVQEAANLAARIAGQETVGGAKDFATMMEDNGLRTSLNVDAVGDPDPTEECQQTDPKAQQECLDGILTGKGSKTGTKLDADAQGSTGVYWKYRRLVYNLFSAGEQKHLYVPPPKTRGGTSEVRVTRIMKPPKVLGWQMPAVSVSATAYGGEDSYMYSLPRFGRTGGNSGNELFWEQTFKKNAKLKDTSQD